MRFEHIYQRGPGDCGLACLAMMVRRPYDEVLETVFKGVFKHDEGMHDAQIIGALGFFYGRHVNKTDGWIESLPCIVTVPSLRNPGKLHYVFWTGARVLDPRDAGDGPVYNSGMLGAGACSAIYSTDISPERNTGEGPK